MNVSLFTVRHVFVEFVEMGRIWNPEYGIRNPLPFVIREKSFRIYNIFLYLFFFFKLENIKQEVSEVFLACFRH